MRSKKELRDALYDESPLVRDIARNKLGRQGIESSTDKFEKLFHTFSDSQKALSEIRAIIIQTKKFYSEKFCKKFLIAEFLYEACLAVRKSKISYLIGSGAKYTHNDIELKREEEFYKILCENPGVSEMACDCLIKRENGVYVWID